MSSAPRARAHDRLVELVVVLSGAPHAEARVAVRAAIDRNGDAGDNLFNVADAIVSLRDGHRDRDAVGSS